MNIISERLTKDQRNQLVAQLDQDGYAKLPFKLPLILIEKLIDAIDRISSAKRKIDPTVTGVKVQNCVDVDNSFRELMMYRPALECCYDHFGPMFHLNQSNFISRPKDKVTKANFLSSSPWHADGPRPNLFPQIDDACGLHYLKFGYFLTDLSAGNGGALQVIRGSHKRRELDGKKDSFDVNDYEEDLVEINCEAGEIVVFHQAQWHAAPPNKSDIERKNVYISYCPTWMRPFDRGFPINDNLEGLNGEERWLLGEPRPAQRWWLPSKEDIMRMDAYK